MKYIQTILFLFCLVSFIGCQPSEPENKTKEIKKKLSPEVQKSPETETASLLLANAREDLDHHRFESAKKKLESIIHKYPETDEANSARKLIYEIDRKSKKRKVAKKQSLRTPAALQKMRVKMDPKTGITWYKDKKTPRYNNINSFYLYFGKKKNERPSLRLRIRYCSDEWLHIMSYLFMVDNERYLKSMVKFKRLQGASSYQELYDEPVTPENYPMIRKIIHSQKTTIRLHGQKGIGDMMLTAAQKKSMKNVLEAFKVTGGRL